MKGALFLGWRYLSYHRFKTAVLLGAVTLMMFLPAATRLLVEDSARALTARAAETPLLVGAKGSQLELVLSSLYFHAESPPEITHQAYEDVRGTGLALAIPLHARFQARGHPVVGTNLDYFEFRSLQLAEGRLMGLLGECVIGAGVARRLGVGAGDSLGGGRDPRAGCPLESGAARGPVPRAGPPTPRRLSLLRRHNAVCR